MDDPDFTVRTAWVEASTVLDGDRSASAVIADDLVQRYRDPPRRYHSTAHVAAMLHDVDELADVLTGTQRATVRAAACAHDVVYLGRPGTDERASAEWARDALTAAGVPEHRATRVHGLVVATADHRAAPGDLLAAILLDADLAVLARPPAGYADYVAAVRAEYARVDDAQWRRGRAAVLRGLLDRNRLYATGAGFRRWERAARDNMSAELDALTAGPGGG